MRTFTTLIKTVDKGTFSGPRIKAISWKQAEHICREIYPYATVSGELVAEIDQETGKKTNYGTVNKN